MKIGTVCYCTRQGIGWLGKWYYDNGVITDVVLMHHSHRYNHKDWYPKGTPVVASRPLEKHESIRELVRRVDMMLFIETPFDWEIIRYCREHGVKTVIMPMYECTPIHVPHKPDLWLCPSLLDVEYFPGSPFVPVPVPKIEWKRRFTAKRFLHNGGNLGLRGHKGTLEILKAMKYVKSPIELKVTSQDGSGLQRIISQVPEIRSDSRVTFSTDDVPWETLYDDYDVFIMAEKYNGLSLPLAEARAAGMLVMTSDRFPINTWLPSRYLIPVDHYTEEQVGGSFNKYKEAVVRPQDIAATIDATYGEDIQEYSTSGLQWAMDNSWEVLKPQIMAALESV